MKTLTKNIIPLILLTLVLLAESSFAQISERRSMLVSNTSDEDNSEVMIKWITDEVLQPNGVHIYRKQEGGSWQRITDDPFKKGDYRIPREAYRTDDNLEEYESMIADMTRDKLKGVAKAMILIKASLSTPYARFLGIQYHDTDVRNGKTYRYKVMKVTPSGEQEIGISRAITVEKHIPGPPPENIQVKAGDQLVELKWKPDKLRFLGVNIFKKTEKQEGYAKINDFPVVTSKRTGPDGKKAYPDIFYTDDSLENGITYHYKVEAIDYFGRPMKHSKAFEVTPSDQTPPPAPQFPKANVDNLTVSLTWKNKQSPDIEGYKVYRSLKSDTGFTPVHKNLLPRGTESHTDNVPEPGNYYYHVAAVDSSGNEGTSYNTMARVLDIYPPDKPVRLYTEADTGRITLHWQPNTEDDLLGYKVYRTVNKDDSSQYVLLTGSTISDTTYIDTLPKSARNKFFYRVVAVDSAFNNSDYSDFASNHMPDVIPPAKPHIKDVVITENDHLEIRWVANADKDLKGYRIYRTEERDSLPGKEKLNENLLSPVVEHFTDRWAEAGTGYEYYLQAVDSTGNTSVLSEPFPGRVPEPQPQKPEDVIRRFRVRTRDGKNILRWGVNEPENYLGCIVFRKAAGGRYRPLNALSKESKYKDRELEADTTYFYQVRAYDDKRGVARSQEEKVDMPKNSDQ